MIHHKKGCFALEEGSLKILKRHYRLGLPAWNFLWLYIHIQVSRKIMGWLPCVAPLRESRSFPKRVQPCLRRRRSIRKPGTHTKKIKKVFAKGDRRSSLLSITFQSHKLSLLVTISRKQHKTFRNVHSSRKIIDCFAWKPRFLFSM